MCVGFGRSGTRWLAVCLSEHPEISMSEFCKTTELNYFPEEYEVMGLKNYIKRFRGADFSKIVGEVSCTPIMHKRSAPLIKKLFPKVKIIICQRDEIARAKSVQKADAYIDLKKNPPLKTINQEEYIAPFRKVFGKDLFIFNMQKNRQAELNRLFKFLGISPFVPRSLNAKVGVGVYKTKYTPLRKVINFIKPRIRRHKRFFYFLKRSLHLDRGYQIFSEMI